jgi:hypothetical protein
VLKHVAEDVAVGVKVRHARWCLFQMSVLLVKPLRMVWRLASSCAARVYGAGHDLACWASSVRALQLSPAWCCCPFSESAGAGAAD